MTGRWRPRSVRVRLTLWHLAALVAVLTLYATGVFLFVRHGLVADLDGLLNEDLERAESSFGRNADGTLTCLVADREPPDPADPDMAGGPWTSIWAPEGRALYTDPLAPSVLRTFPGAAPVSGRPAYQSVQSPDGAWLRELTGWQSVAGAPAVVRIARSETRIRQEARQLLAVLGFGLPVACAIAGLGAYLVARRALAPIDRMAAAARHITAARLGDRLPVANPDDELGHLASVFNDTFARLEASFEQLKRFTADASHEMRTPLTAIRAVGEVGLREPRTDRGYREIIGSMLEETDRLNRVVESLLTLARAEGGSTLLGRERVDLAALTREAVDHLSVLADEKRQTIALDAAHAVAVMADRVVLRQAIINLLDNAIKYSPEEGCIAVSVAARSPETTITVRDSGPGIAAEHVGRIFERFYRIDKSRSREGGGAGLGLSIARWAVEAHGGRIDVEAAQPQGTVFRIVLPTA